MSELQELIDAYTTLPLPVLRKSFDFGDFRRIDVDADPLPTPDTWYTEGEKFVWHWDPRKKARKSGTTVDTQSEANAEDGPAVNVQKQPTFNHTSAPAIPAKDKSPSVKEEVEGVIVAVPVTTRWRSETLISSRSPLLKASSTMPTRNLRPIPTFKPINAPSSSLPPRASNGSGTIALADLRVINLQHQHNSFHADDHKSKAAQTVSLPVSKSRSYVCSVASDGPPLSTIISVITSDDNDDDNDNNDNDDDDDDDDDSGGLIWVGDEDWAGDEVWFWAGNEGKESNDDFRKVATRV
ncbi:hypothetical protein QBC32DRAFT_314514 [Pseudoneurospora amorphoporcata]|uniref:Uncharacterized protein n=1 Tax=Pseudoneurospora amorphoporcata TaxID=241081 RepID=A0AAN6NTZ9_9PEZI|nr:hypothetical protein QBC32DRAFT_314514 [Pseudoneurospora amorphoporcata]